MFKVKLINFRKTTKLRFLLIAVLFFVSQTTFVASFINTASALTDVYRSTTYQLQPGTFTGTTYNLKLNNNLQSDYFAMVSGPSSNTASRGPNQDFARVSADPFANFATTSSADEIQLTRESSNDDWIGAITVLECMTQCDTDGFRLKQVLQTSLPAGATNGVRTVTVNLAQNHTANTAPFGGRFGGGITTASTDVNEYATTLGVKISKAGANQVRFDRFGGEGRAVAAATVVSYVVEWGNQWNVQSANVTGTNGGTGTDATNEYNTAAISTVNRDSSWVWGSGFTRNDGLADGAFGQVITLGNGVAQNAIESSVAVGSNNASTSPGRDFQVFVFEHPLLEVDHRFRTIGDSGASSGYQELDAAINAPSASESYDNSSSTVRYTEGKRIPIFYNSSTGTGQAYSRTGAWGLRIDGSTNLNYWRAYSGQNVMGWIQSVDFGAITYSNVDTRQQSFRWRDDSTALNSAGGWLAAEDTNLNYQSKNSQLRLRIKVANFGQTPEDSSRAYELQFAAKGGFSCSDITTWFGVEDSASDAIAMYDSTNISPDGQPTTSGLLSNGDGFTFVAGEAREIADTTSPIGPIANSSYSELEYAITPTDTAITGETYCFRVYDKTSNSEIDSYSVYPELNIRSINTPVDGLGETGTFSSAIDGGWTTVNFIGTYSSPVVVGTTNTHDGQSALVFETRNVTSTSAQMRVCESEGATSNGCDTHGVETVGYMVIDANIADNTPGIEAGNFIASGEADTSSVNTNFVESFGTTPYVFANVNTVNSTEFPIEVVISSTSATNFIAGICDHLQGNNDNCDPAHGNETVGWVAIDPSNIPFIQQSDAGTAISAGNGAWASVSFSTPFSATPVLLAASQTDTGSQDVEIDEARLVTSTGAEVRSCEIDTLDSCDSHSPDTMAWLAVEPGVLTYYANLDQSGYRFYENNNNLTPTTPLENENTALNNVNSGDVLRLRIAVQNGLKDLQTGGVRLKAQYGQGTNCSAISTWTDVGAIGSGSVWRGFNGTPSNGSNLPSSLLDAGTNVAQSYQEQNPTGQNPYGLLAGQNGEWDFVIQNNGASNFTSYCFRVTTSSGAVVNYSSYPKLTTSTGVPNLNPNNPVGVSQNRTSDLPIALAEVINETSVKFTANVSDANFNDILQLCVEADEIGATFSGVEDSCGNPVVYSGDPLAAEAVMSGFINDKSYHWQVRVKDATGAYSAWVSFGGNSESEADFTVDTVGPTVFVYDGQTSGSDVDYNDGSLSDLSANWVKQDGLEPNQISGLTLWLDGDDINGNGVDPLNGSSINTWFDKSGRSNNINGTGAATFDAARQAVGFSDTARPFDSNYNRSGGNANSQTIFAIVEGNATVSNHVWYETTTPRVAPAENGLLGGGTTLSNNNFWPNHMTKKQLLTLEYLSTGTSSAWLDNKLEYQFSEIQTFANTQRMVIGDDTTGGNQLEAGEYVNEIIVYNQDLTSPDREKLWESLNCKWGIKDCSVIYEYSIGTSPGASNVLDWAYAGSAVSFDESGLDLSTTATYYVNVRATDIAGNQTISSSDGLIVAPTISFDVGTTQITFDNLNVFNNMSDTEDVVLSTTTNARNGYQIRSYATGNLSNGLQDVNMFSGGSYATPSAWGSGDYGYGYTSNDNLINGVNMFNPATCLGGGAPPCFAPFSLSSPGDIVADNQSVVSGAPILNEQFTITHKVTTQPNQNPGSYQTTVIYSASAKY